MPVIYIDALLLGSLLVAAIVLGLGVGWWVSRRRSPEPSPSGTSTETSRLLHLMSRADHAMESYVTAIQGNLSVLGDDLPTDAQRWTVSRDAIAHAADQMKRLRRDALTRAGHRPSRHSPRHLQGDTDRAGMGDPRHGMPRQASQHRDATTASRQQHDTRSTRLPVERQRLPVGVEFR